MPSPYYKSPHWKALRAEALKRDRYRCAAPGCRERATHVDHIATRPRDATGPTPADRLDNLRCVCISHDAQVKERGGKRNNDGKFTVKGCDASGMPLDPNHPWNKA